MKIVQVESYILHIPVTGSRIADSTHSVTHWGVVGAKITAEDGRVGYGFTGTHADLPSDKVIAGAIETCYAPLLVGTELERPDSTYRRLFHHPPLQWVGRAGILQLALCAVDVALWDLFAKVREAPLWQVFGTPARKSVAAYNTDVGWLSFSDDELVDNVSRAVDQGFTAVKMKVGGPRLSEDILRCTKVREAVGPTVIVATDANGKWDLPTALRFARESADLDLFWVEEPLWYDDVESHVELARQAVLQIALGEQIYTPQGMSQFIRRKAVHYVQPDVTRIGGVSGFLQAASYAEGAGLPIAAHAGDMSQVHVHMAYALANHTMLEYIPWIAHAFREPARVVHGEFERPSQPGASTTPTDEAFAEYRVD